MQPLRGKDERGGEQTVKLLRIIDKGTGNVELEQEVGDDFCVQFTLNEPRDIKRIGNIGNAVFGEKHEIKNWYYVPIAEQLIGRFEELSHIAVSLILFLENTDWEPPEGGLKKNTWIARVKKADAFLKNIWQYSYVIEIKNWFSSQMSKEQIVALLYHELRHIGTDGELCSHDIEDWGNMVATLGVGWTDRHAEIIDILDEEFSGWDDMRQTAQQLDLFSGPRLVEGSAAKK